MARPARREFFRSLRAQAKVLLALSIRDALSHAGHEGIGFFWVVGEPLFLAVGVMAMWALVKEQTAIKVGVVPFALTGYVMITLFRHISGKSVHVMRRNAWLIFHPNVRYLDVVLSLCLLESIALLSTFLLAYVPLVIFGVVGPPTDLLNMFGGYLFMAWFSTSIGILLAATSELVDGLEHVIPPVLYIALPFSGLFYFVDWLPPAVRGPLLWSPMVNAMEMFRSGVFPRDVPTEWDVSYTFWCCIGTTAAGLAVLRYAQNRVKV